MLGLGGATFFLFGVVLVLIGANQDHLARDLGLDLSKSGLLVAALAGGLGIGVMGAGPLFDRFPRRPLFVASSLVAAAGLLGFAPTISFPGAVCLVALIGLGTGAYDTLFNAAIVERYHEAAARPMSVLHAVTPVGAIVAPIAVAVIAHHWHWVTSFQWTGIGHLALAAAAFFVRFPAPPPRRTKDDPPAQRVLSWPLLPFAIAAFAYVGIEGALTIFAIPYAVDGLGLDAERGVLAISTFWGGLLVGRLAPLLLRGRLDARALVASGVFSSVTLGAGIASAAGLAMFFAVVGFTLGCVYPVMIALAGQRFPAARGAAAGFTAGAGALGGFVIPWLTGAIGDRGGIDLALSSLVLWSIAIAAAGLAAQRERTPIRNPVASIE